MCRTDTIKLIKNDIYIQIDTNPLTFYTELGIIIKALFILNKDLKLPTPIRCVEP